jgi:hypothetical protein
MNEIINYKAKAAVERAGKIHRERRHGQLEAERAAYFEALAGDLTAFAEEDGSVKLIDSPSEEESRGKVILFETDKRSMWLHGGFTLAQLRQLVEHAEKHCDAHDAEWPNGEPCAAPVVR